MTGPPDDYTAQLKRAAYEVLSMTPEQRAREFVEVGFRDLGVPLEPYVQIIAELIAGAETELRAEVDRLTAALQPFADEYDKLMQQQDSFPAWHSVKTADLRNARAALEPKP
jgi:hypothetical protein